MSRETIAKLGQLMARSAILQVGGQYDAAGDLERRIVGELGDLDDEDARLTFMTSMGFLSALNALAPNAQSVALLSIFKDAATDGEPEAMRSAVQALLGNVHSLPDIPLSESVA